MSVEHDEWLFLDEMDGHLMAVEVLLTPCVILLLKILQMLMKIVDLCFEFAWWDLWS